jgi:branched-chain amino acid transport system ATP-binding protein
MEKEILLRLENGEVHYGGVHALVGADIQIDEGEIVALMGPNGAGKSTALKAMFGLAPMFAGKVLYHEKKINPKPHEMVERGIAFVPQGRRVFTHLTVEENLEIGGFSVKSKDEIKRRISDVMELFPILREKRKAKSGSLSGGQQQMLAIARGLMVDPQILLLDEPTLGLAPKIVKEVFAKIKEINERRKMAVVIVEHNIRSLLDVADRAYVLNRGKVVLAGEVENIRNSQILQDVFLGRME